MDFPTRENLHKIEKQINELQKILENQNNILLQILKYIDKQNEILNKKESI